ncbi:PIN domain-containing protein [Sedimentibacter sp.]|uniref:PIN domain-containing protein n=1 Tax=Sedimentibacter sp. TaxID=1960295 RepID=UPI0028A02DDF|nr:PIN domain-containing protein [Sedimentibacter sp.]
MKIVDANVVLRYLLNDNDELSRKAADILENDEIFIPNEVIAEIVYVLQKVYTVKNDEISNILLNLLQYENLNVYNIEVVKEAFVLFSNRKIDFVDTLLYAYHKVNGYEVCTFDKNLRNN